MHDAMTIDTKALREWCNGWRGRFFFDEERGDLAYIAKDCDDKQCDCEVQTNSDGDQDCSVSLGVLDEVDDTMGPIAQVLNALPALLARVEEQSGTIELACIMDSRKLALIAERGR